MTPDGGPRAVTLCICTYNRLDWLSRALESVRASGATGQRVLVSDDSHDHEATRRLCARFPDVEVVRGPQRGVGANRASCPATVRTSHLTFIDDDATVRPGFFTLLDALLDEIDVGDVVTGHVVNHYPDGRVVDVRPGAADFLGFATRPWGSGHGNMIEMNATLFPVRAFDTVSFDHRLRYGYEELDISRQLEAAGYRVRFDPRLVVDHYPEATTSGYHAFVDAARLYATFKHYARFERSPVRAAAYAAVGPAHHLLAGASRRHPGLTLRSATRDIVTATRLVRDGLRAAGG